MEKIAVIGAGPAGLVAARWLKHVGFEPTLFEQGDSVGGQWTCDPKFSAVWPSLRTNSSRIMTAFSDLDHEAGAGVYPTNQAVRAYLSRYADQFDLLRCARLRTTVREIRRDAPRAAWRVRFTDAAAEAGEEIYSKVVIAIGRHNNPTLPAIPGLQSFSGAGGVIHTFQYKQPERYRDWRVLVAGCGVSALEVASDLAMLGSPRVVVSNRRQRYVIPKLCAGVPADHLAYTRFGALAARYMPADAVAARTREFILRVAGNPAQVGAPAPADDFARAGFALCQHFLPLVAERRIEIRPWIAAIDGSRVRFSDGSVDEFDAIVFGTGYEMRFPFFPQNILSTLGADGVHVDLHDYTFHPDLPGLAFVLVRQVVGPNFPLAEIQSRWVAYAWSGACPAPSEDEMRDGLALCRAQRGGPTDLQMQNLALLFATQAGVEPDLERWPDLTRALLFGPLSPVSFRLNGPDSLSDAPARTRAAAAAFGAIPSMQFTPGERAQLTALAAARHDPAFTRFVEQLAATPVEPG